MSYKSTYDVTSLGLISNEDNSGDKTFVYSQAVPATTWTVQHGLNKFPSITVVDSAKTVVVGDYTYVNNNKVTLEFSAPFAGKAYLN